jgi:predicted small lipoprotein YifL
MNILVQKGDQAMWTRKILSMLFIVMTLLTLITACATPGDKNPLRYEPENLPADHRPPPTSGGP